MGEAEKSIAIKRRLIAPNQAREESPSDVYEPKRKKSSGDQEPSPPPYIPSRKESFSTISRASQNSSSTHGNVSSDHKHSRRGDFSDSRSEHARQTLSSQDRRDLIARSRRMELFKHIGIDRREPPVRGSSGDVKHSRQSPRRIDSRKIADHDQRLKESGSNTREVCGRRRDNDSDNDDAVKDLSIKARLGPAVRKTSALSETKKSSESSDVRTVGGVDLRDKMIRSTYSKDTSLQIMVNPMTSPALKGSVASRLGKIVVRKRGSDEDDDVGDDGGSIRKYEIKSEGGGGRKAVSSLAKSLVNRQCREAVMSVSTGGRRRRHSVSPDSRRVEASCDVDDEHEDEVEEEEEIEGENVIRSGVVADDKTVSVTVKQNVMEKTRQPDCDVITLVSDAEEYNDKDEEEKASSEDLAEILGEQLEPELLKDSVQDELNLELEEDIEKMIGVKGQEDDRPKAGTRFIVTLDGVDERQLCADNNEASRCSGKDTMNPTPFIQPRAMETVNPLQPKRMPPSAPPTLYLPPPPPAQQSMPLPGISMQHQANISPILINPGDPNASFPAVVYNSPSLLPPTVSNLMVAQTDTTKPLPPKIQPFSINLKDSDDEFEDAESRMQRLPSASSSYTEGHVRQTSSNTSLPALTAIQKSKMSERCKFWPACAAGSECEFHHPTSHCKTFPNCKFADKCLFIHPNCRFDSRCTRQDCPYTHTSRRPGITSSSSSIITKISFHPPKPPPPIPAPTTTSTVCRFFPNCQNPSCLFFHPKPCRFGTACQNPGCLFYHPTPAPLVPNKDKLKWKAQPLATHTSQPHKNLPANCASAPSSSLSTVDPAAKFRQPVAKVSPMSSATSS